MSVDKLQEHGLRVVQQMTTPSRPGKAPRPVWVVEGITAGYEPILYELGGKKFRGQFSFWEDPTEALAQAIESQGRASFAERQEQKVERAEERAERYDERAAAAQGRANAIHDQAKQMADRIPFGQPILIGHHSEKRDRSYRGRIHSRFGKAFEEQGKAEHYEQRAAAAERNAAPKDVGFMNRRLEESEAGLRDIERKLSENVDWSIPRNAEWRLRLEALRTEHTDRIAYWRDQIEQAGGVKFSRETIKKGDYVFRLKDKRPFLVLRVNAKTVTAQSTQPGCSWFEPKIPYAEICGCQPASQVSSDAEVKL
jgi:hypothetical protein